MRTRDRLALMVAMALLASMPAAAWAGGPPSGGPNPPSNQGTAPKPSDPGSQGSQHASSTAGSQAGAPQPSASGPGAGLPAKANADGRYCRGESKTHVAGQHGTPFSVCVTAMAKLAAGVTDNPRSACKDESKKHVAGRSGTPFSRCIAAAAQLQRDASSSDDSSADVSGS